MYETEVNNSVESIEALSEDIRERFAELRDRIVARTTLPWGEHCTECVWPSCYTTCELYSPRKDGACRQFIDGIVRIDHDHGLSPYLQKIRFKQWAKLWTVGNLHLQPLSRAARAEWFNIVAGAVGKSIPLPGSIKQRVLGKINYLRKKSAEGHRATAELPDYFLLECFNPNTRKISLTFTVRPRPRNGRRPFQTMISVPPGYVRGSVPFSQISHSVDMGQPFEVEIVPNDCANTVLYFGLMDFVKERQSKPVTSAKPREAKFKCIVWDLDNTLWDGVLVEEGPERVSVRQDVLDVIRELDHRGILHSIASKNNHDEAMEVLRSCGVDDYFLYPQINWHPKSQSVAQIAKLLNIDTDTVAFVDDQAFEREEVKAALLQVTVIDAADYVTIPDRPECCVPVTAESKARRSMYREQAQRERVLESYGGDYIQFLKDCCMEVSIGPLGDANLRRVYELAQRTNQLNFSGNRYPEGQLRDIMKSDFFETYVIDCSDRFGSYGIVGFAVVDSRVPRLLDLMFSCRIQGKRVEHAVLSFLLERFVNTKKRDFYADYRKTSKNSAAGKVFEEVGFQYLGEKEGLSSFVFRHGQPVPDDQIIKVTA
ncbi:MAG TPA: HAD-IIIC family phosphatase [Terriglobales bacterium]|nr:HAD-IIIC family phosphatase [Terriglobales bacterium]